MLVLDNLMPCVPQGMSTVLDLSASGTSGGRPKVAMDREGGPPFVPGKTRKRRREEIFRVAFINLHGMKEEGKERERSKTNSRKEIDVLGMSDGRKGCGRVWRAEGGGRKRGTRMYVTGLPTSMDGSVWSRVVWAEDTVDDGEDRNSMATTDACICARE